jgi:5-methylcytosine-specific restriction endonuclease McrA
MTPEEKRAYNRAYREANRERLLAADRARYELNRAKMNAQNKAYRQAHATEIAEREKRNYEINREVDLKRERLRYEAERDRIKAVQRAYRATRPAAVVDRANRRRAARRATHVFYRPSAIFERDEWMCRLCSEPIDAEITYPDLMSKSIDHVIPLVAGGTDAPDNVQAAHLGCNLHKGARMTPAERPAVA